MCTEGLRRKALRTEGLRREALCPQALRRQALRGKALIPLQGLSDVAGGGFVDLRRRP